MKEFGIYIHIPFCKQKCYYCDFYSVCEDEKKQTEYFNVLKQEIEDVGKTAENVLVKTIYIGGGTPSFVNSKYIVELLKLIKSYFYISENAEVTIEINPGTITREKLEDYISAGINRVSIGMQSSNNVLLKTIGRIHTWEDFLDCYNLVRLVGFNNVNIDCMIGLPNQTLEDTIETINEIIKLRPEHVSMYSLIVEENTPIEKMVDKLPDEKTERAMYHKLRETLQEAGYTQYEISNFAKVGYESKHNLDCWRQKEYIGFGAGAHSYTDGCRYSNIANIDEYIKCYKENRIQDSIIIHEKQDKTAMAKEFILLCLRTIKGCSKKDFYNKFGYDIEKGFSKEFEKLEKQGLILAGSEFIKLTIKGLDLANLVWEEFV